MTRQRGGPPSQRQLRVGEEVRHALVRILARGELRDPDVADVQVTITEVRMSPDLKVAKAFILPFAGPVTAEFAPIVKGLKRAGPFLRGQLAKEIELRFIPSITFEADPSLDRAERIDTLLRDLAASRDPSAESDESP